MVFDVMAWGATFIVGVIFGIGYERVRNLSRLLYDTAFKDTFKEKFLRKTKEKKDTEKVM